MNHIFISYSRQDQAYARQLADDLSRRGFNVWIDDQIDYGERWFKTIVQAIQECAAMVVIMSPEADQSEWVEREILVAQRDHKPLFPLLLRGREFPLLITTQFADVKDGKLPPESFYTRLGQVMSTVIRRPSAVESLFPLFEWIPIPAGKVTLITEREWARNYIPAGRSRTFDIPAFAMAKYPLTNAQYAKFVEAGGYSRKAWWTDAGWKARKQGNWIEPRFWRDSQWNGADYPVVGVSWYEAVAYCRWLSETTGENVMLPTEQQWQRAALGDDGRAYPWGNQKPNKRLGNFNWNTGHTTSVTQYSAVANAYGVMDMSGNVWEWCLTAYETGRNDLNGTAIRVLRGGSWRDDGWYARGVYRNWSSPDLSYDFGGVRVCASAPI